MKSSSKDITSIQHDTIAVENVGESVRLIRLRSRSFSSELKPVSSIQRRLAVSWSALTDTLTRLAIISGHCCKADILRLVARRPGTAGIAAASRLSPQWPAVQCWADHFSVQGLSGLPFATALPS